VQSHWHRGAEPQEPAAGTPAANGVVPKLCGNPPGQAVHLGPADRGDAANLQVAVWLQTHHWDEWPDVTRAFFQAQRTPAGEDLILQKNLFIEYLLPLRKISPEVMEVYRRHYRNPGPSRQPMLAWTRDLPIAGEPADVVGIVDSYARWLSTSPIPKLFIDAEPAGFLIGAQREFCRTWRNQQTVTVQGSHFLPEDAPEAVGEATAHFVAKVLAGQIA
jgi:haloalkane dehalogenase